MNSKIRINLFRDWAVFLEKKLAEMGYTLPTNVSDDERCLYYYDIVDRLPECTPRMIEKADTFSCPPDHSAGIALLEAKIANGEDLKPHLSLGVKITDNFDGLLVDWGIHHLHLGIQPHSQFPDFVERTGPLLYARLTSDKAYFIGIMSHGKWSDRDLVRVLHRNWPSSLDSFRIDNGAALQSSFSDSAIGQLRKFKVNSLLEIEPGITYCNLGSGMTCGKFTLSSAMKRNDIRRFFMAQEKNIDKGYNEWRSRGRDPDGVFDFKLQVSDHSLFADAEEQLLRLKIKECSPTISS